MEPEITEQQYVQSLMDDFGLTRENTIYDLLILLDEEAERAEAVSGDDGNM